MVASARTHARSSRGKTGQPEWDLGPHSQAIKGPHEYYCALLSKSPPTIYKRLANTHKKISQRNGGGGYSSCHRALRKAAANHCAAPDFPSFVQTMYFVQRLLFLSLSGFPRLANCEPARRAVAFLMARFASPPLSPKISFYTVILSA